MLRAVLVLAFLVILVLPQAGFAMSENPVKENETNWSQCSDTIKIEVGGVVFGIPRNSGNIILEHSRIKVPCDDIERVSNFSYSPREFLGITAPDTYLMRFAAWELNEESRDVYTKFKINEKLKEAGVKLKDLPVEHGFYRFNGITETYYISPDPKLETYFGNPFTFVCRGDHFMESEMRCTMSQEWNGILISAGHLRTDIFPTSKAMKIYNQLAEYAESLTIRLPDAKRKGD